MTTFSINGNTSFDEFRKLLCCLQSRQGSISCYHAGKQFAASGYHDGLKVGSSALIRRLAREVFRVRDSSTQQVIHQAIDQFKVEHTGQLHYCLDKRAYQGAYHYLYFGSESLILLADQLKSIQPQHNFRRMLIDSGHPVIISFSLRIAELGDIELEEIKVILENALKNQYRDPFLRMSFVHYANVVADDLLSIKKVKLPANIHKIPES